MSDGMLLILLIAGAVLAFAVGIWVGLGYPGLYGKYESTGRAPRLSPFQMLVDWVYGKLGK